MTMIRGKMPPHKIVRYKGVRLKVYAIGYLAALTDRHTHTVRGWEVAGHLPKPLLALPNEKNRWYTSAELKGYSEIFKRSNVRRKVKISDTSFPRDALTFRASLQAAMETDVSILGKVLTGEHELRLVMSKKHAEAWRKAVKHLIDPQ